MADDGSSGPMIVVALGASNTAGQGVRPEHAFPGVLERLLSARGMNVQIVNAGIAGNTTGEMLSRLAADIPEGVRLVLLQPGGNDARLGHAPAIREHNIREIQARLAARGIGIVRVSDALAAVRPGNLLPDGVHFTETGHALIAELLVDRVAAALQARS